MFNQQDWIEIDKLIEVGYISKRKHPFFDFWVLNYTVKTQFDWVWNKYTMACRGLIVDVNNKIIAKPFPKFFNNDQLEKMGWKIPNEPFELFEKMDGSLGILFHKYSSKFNKWSHHIATRGSFESEQAVKANELLIKKYNCVFNSFNPKYTYLFEILCSESKVVVDYPEEKLVLLGAIKTSTGEEIEYKNLYDITPPGIEIVSKYKIKDWKNALNKFDGTNKEGFVVKFKSGFRVKIKYEKYKELHRALCGLSARRIWEQLSMGKYPNKIVEIIPDEFHSWTKEQIDKLIFNYEIIESYIKKVHSEIVNTLNVNYSQKDFALKAKENKFSGLIFALEKNIDYSSTIWKIIKPKGNVLWHQV